MTKNNKMWLRGLIATVVNGFASGMVLIIADPVAFNLDAGLRKLVMTSAVFAIFGLANYLKQHPLPDDEDVVTLRGLVLPLLLAGSLVASCVTMGPRAQLVTTHQGIQTLLASADDAERILCFGQLALPATPTECSTAAAAQVGLTDARHRAIRRAFVKAYNAQIALGAVIDTWTPGTSVDLSVLLEAAAEIDAQLALMDIKAPNLSDLIQDVLRWKAEIERLRKSLGGGL